MNDLLIQTGPFQHGSFQVSDANVDKNSYDLKIIDRYKQKFDFRDSLKTQKANISHNKFNWEYNKNFNDKEMKKFV